MDAPKIRNIFYSNNYIYVERKPWTNVNSKYKKLCKEIKSDNSMGRYKDKFNIAFDSETIFAIGVYQYHFCRS